MSTRAVVPDRSFALRPAAAVLIALLVTFASPSEALEAGVLCGTVRDAVTQATVAGAAVVAFTTIGEYAGFGAVTDAQGSFCIAGIPPGTYDLQVRVDDYATGHVRGVVVTESSTGADIVLAPAALAPPNPNPANSSVRFQIRLAEPCPVRLAIFDVAGRLVYGWQTERLGAGVTAVSWDLRDMTGRDAPAGWYFVRLTAGENVHSRKLALVH